MSTVPNQTTTPPPPFGRNRRNYFIQSFSTISRTSKVLLLLSLAMVAIQIVVTVTVLIIARDKDCDKPLKIFLILYIIRVIIACPVNVYLYLNPRDNRRNEQNQNENNTRRDNWIDRFKSSLDLFATLWFIIGNYLLFTTETCQVTAPEIFFLSLTWVILGYIIITIPILLCLAVIFCLPCVIVAMRVLRVGEAVGITGASDDLISKIPSYKYKSYDNCQREMEQGTMIIVTIPTTTTPTTTSSSNNNNDNDGNNNNNNNINNVNDTIVVVQPLNNSPSLTTTVADASSSTNVTPQPDQTDQQNKKFKYKFWNSKIFGNKQSSSPTNNNSSNNNNSNNNNGSNISSTNSLPLQYIAIKNPEDAACSICLSPYVDDEELRHLYCQHHFHRECVDEWLKLNKKCPMCRMDIEEMIPDENNKNRKDVKNSSNNSNHNSSGEGSSSSSGSSRS